MITDLFAGIARRNTRLEPNPPSSNRFLANHSDPPGLGATLRRIGVSPGGLFYISLPNDGTTRLRHSFPASNSLSGSFFSVLAYIDFAIVRQTFCKYLCPYARFQGVLFDSDSLVIGYDFKTR